MGTVAGVDECPKERGGRRSVGERTSFCSPSKGGVFLAGWAAHSDQGSVTGWQRNGRRRDGFPAGGGGDGDTRACTGGCGW